MEASILKTINHALGVSEDGYEYFVPDLVMYINMALNTLTQLGVGPKRGFSITGYDEQWSDFIGTDPRLEMVKAYVTISVRLMFDTPLNSSVTDVLNNKLKEMEWRLNVQVDPGPNDEEEIQNG